ncbi:MAG: mannitol dehydrogenase family protein [Proteobacteria bacterium]|nr:mannitol dehydrogenase family protein [Pseudomonadota bacterium]
MARLALATLDRVPHAIARPRYRPQDVPVGIVHLGLGAFHRAHQAIATDDVLAEGGGNWGICGVSLRSPGVRDRLAPQDGLYTAIERSPAGMRRRIVGSVREVLCLAGERDAVLRRLASPEVAVVTLTVTEKGYCHRPSTGTLDFAHPAIVHDLAHPGAPVSTLGVLVCALGLRRASHGVPMTVVCCDNLPHNGALVASLAGEFAAARDATLAAWIGREVAFPATMVDRIVPAATGADRDENDAALGCDDLAPVVHEPFMQWVIEDRFAGKRPAWERAGATLTADVEPWETMKLRMLNGTHSALAYLGCLAGHRYVHEVVAQPEFAAWARRYLEREVAPTLAVPPGADLARYRESLLTRFANPALGHRTSQIAMDGSQKLPQRILATVRANLARGRDVGFAALAVAGWMRYVRGDDEAGRPIEVSDPLAPRFAAIASRCGSEPAAYARALLALSEVFGDDLAREPRFVSAVSEWLATLCREGAARAVAHALNR